MIETQNRKPLALRCAIYTRKSTEEGLDQEFNSLDAQREACEAFIQSQKHLGWQCLPDHYDDGGFTGANMDRPALGRLMVDIENSKIDVVVVYKVDRLSRSLLDFARLIETFDRYGISFVSITQQFNTATSLGRLVLNILLSFAQFEREMIAERTRDKMGAARRKGKWIGGRPPLGYDIDANGKRLVVNKDEADQVRAIFGLYLQERSLLRAVEILNARGWTLKTWMTRSERRHEGGRWCKSAVQRLLTNVAYIGKVKYEGVVYPGEHEPIVNEETFRLAGDILAGRKETRSSPGNKHGFLLRGLIRCTACNSAMTSVVTAPRGKPYRYYACSSVHHRGKSECEVRSVPAQAIEEFVIERVREMGRDPSLAISVIQAMIAHRKRDVPELEKEQRRLAIEMERHRTEAKQLIVALAQQTNTDGRFVAERLNELEAWTATAEQRLLQIHESLAAINRTTVTDEEVVQALSMFAPVWDALMPTEQSRVLHLLIESIAYDGKAGEIAITFMPAGIACLAQEALASAPGTEAA